MNRVRGFGKDEYVNLTGKTVIPISTINDIVRARQQGRELALASGFTSAESTLVATVISELARNIVLYAKQGEIVLDRANGSQRNGIIIISKDHGPGIADVERALAGGYSTSGGLGLGLSGVRRIVDEFSINTASGNGTTVVATIWM